MKNFILPMLLLFLLISCGLKNEKTTSYEAGFKIIKTVDKKRIYKPDSDITHYLHFRPLEIDLWYPAIPSATDTPLLFRNLLGLLEERANYYAASKAADGVSQQIAQLFCNIFKCSDTTRLLDFKTKTFKNAYPVKNQFPLVIYLTAYNGMSYENFTLFEELASKGFVVASISSIGRFPGDMTMKKEDLMEQVNDAIVSVSKLRESSNVNFSKISIVGYSWGGLAGSILASKIPGVACLVSLEGSEFHHYGQSKEEDADFDGIRNSPDFRTMRLTTPYLRVESSPEANNNKAANNNKKVSVYNFSEKISCDKYVYKVDSAQHQDFGCLSLVVRESGNCPITPPFTIIKKLAVSFLEDHLKDTNSFSKILVQELNKTVRKKSNVE